MEIKFRGCLLVISNVSSNELDNGGVSELNEREEGNR